MAFKEALAPDLRNLNASHASGSDANIALALFNVATLRHNCDYFV